MAPTKHASSNKQTKPKVTATERAGVQSEDGCASAGVLGDPVGTRPSAPGTATTIDGIASQDSAKTSPPTPGSDKMTLTQQHTVLIKDSTESIKTFVERAKKALQTPYGVLLLKCSDDSSLPSVNEDTIKSFKDTVDIAASFWKVDDTDEDFTTGDEKSGYVPRNYCSSEIEKRRPGFREYILETAHAHGIVRGKWYLTVQRSVLPDVLQALLLRYEAGKLGVFLEAKHTGGSNNVAVYIWTSDFQQQEDAEKVILQLKKDGILQKFVTRNAFYKPEAFTILKLYHRNSRKIKVSLYDSNRVVEEVSS